MLGNGPVVHTGVIPHDEGAFLDLLGDQADQMFADDTHEN